MSGVSPRGELWRFVGVAACVALLCIGGIHWLRQSAMKARTGGSPPVMRVQLAPSPSPADSSREAAVRQPSRPVHPADPAPPPAAAPSRTEAKPETDRPRSAKAERGKVAARPEAGGSGGAAAGRNFQRQLLAHIEPFRRYPEAARGQMLNGTVQLVFVLKRDGTLLDVRVLHSSGSPILDREAIDTIWRARPFPPVPPGLPDRLNVLIPVDFTIGDPHLPRSR